MATASQIYEVLGSEKLLQSAPPSLEELRDRIRVRFRSADVEVTRGIEEPPEGLAVCLSANRARRLGADRVRSAGARISPG